MQSKEPKLPFLSSDGGRVGRRSSAEILTKSSRAVIPNFNRVSSDTALGSFFVFLWVPKGHIVKKMWGKEMMRNRLRSIMYVNYLLYYERITNYEAVRREILPYIKRCKTGAHCLLRY